MADFSCYITIINQSSVPLTNGSYYSDFGTYVTRPETNIAVGGTTSFQLEDPSGPFGAEGSLAYDAGEGVIECHYDCPYRGDNNLSVYQNTSGLLVFFYGNNGVNYPWVPDGSNWGQEGQYPSNGHPLSGLFVVKDNPS
jgi:hypothetical protein